MPSRILLISANRCTAPDPVFPLGLACLSTALRRAGHACAWFDCLLPDARLEERVESFRPHYIGISLRNIDDVLIRTRQTFFGELASLRERIRRTCSCPVILGGSGFSLFPRQLLELAGADFGIVGEGETSFPALINALEQDASHQHIPGLVFRKDGSVTINTPCATAFGGEVDRPPDVTKHYLATSGVLNLQTQRGCSFRCSYCTYPLVEGRQHRRRPPEAVAEDLAQLHALGARYAFIVDSTFNSSPRHVTEVCEAILRRNVKLAWGCFLRPQSLTAELMKLMARAGLAHIEFGSDSFSDEVLAACRKDLSFADIQNASELARQAGIDACHFLIIGGPGETEATLETSFRNSQRLKGAVIMAVVGTRIYPGTHLFDQAVAEGVLARDADLLNPVYYLAPGLEPEALFARLAGFARLAPNWIVGDPAPAYTNLVQRMRRRGVVGPLWGYFSMMQRLWPQGLPGTPTL